MFVQIVILILSVRTYYSKTAHNKDLRILGGKDGNYHKYPYIVRLEMKIGVPIGSTEASLITLIIPMHSCSCTALTPIWTLTAAHCVPTEDNKEAQLFIRYGSKKPSDVNSTVIKVLEYKAHPSYRLYDLDNVPIKVENDVAVLKTEPIIIPLYGRLSAIEYSSLFGQSSIACGYGLTNDTNGAGVTEIADTLILNKPLQIVNVLMMRCTSEFTYGIVHPAICVARKCGHSVAMCPGDSGGPLLHPSGVVGVISLGGAFDCNNNIPEKSNLVGMITAISPFVEWIGNIING